MFNLCAVFCCCVTLCDGLRTVPLYARDFSEHCKRRDALPSVFLGRQVMEANSQVLHFSKLDMPYSCYASISNIVSMFIQKVTLSQEDLMMKTTDGHRNSKMVFKTEASHNIIMVIQLDKSDQDFCEKGYQLAVYDFAETFGGYWGPLPEALLERDPSAPVYTKQYTLETKPPPVATETTKDETEEATTSSTTTRSRSTLETQDFINIEVPIVNLSASLVPSDTQDQKAFDIDEFFDLFYDVTPRPGTPYDTSILPLVQISVKKQDGRRDSEAEGEPRYELDYNVGPYTLDHRLTITVPEWPTKINTNRNRNRWKKKKLQDKEKTNKALHTRGPVTRKLKQYSLPTKNHRPTYKYVTPFVITEKKYEDTKDKEPFTLIDDIMKSLNETGDLKRNEPSTQSDVLDMLNMPENSLNLSAYLAPYPTFTFLPVSDLPVNFTKIWSQIPSSETTAENILRISSQDPQVDYKISKSMLEDIANLYQNEVSSQHPNIEFENVFVKKENVVSTKEIVTAPFDVLPPLEETTKVVNETIISSKTSTNADEKFANAATTDIDPDKASLPGTATETLSGTLVDRESWDNVVQSAPVMAGLLNQHGSEVGNSSYINASDVLTPRSKRGGRRKRHISAIAVQAARPHRRATAREPEATASRYVPADVHEFARLMELPDDQMSNRVAIKLDTNVSTKLFNLCEAYDGIKTRFLLLFNSSRIILSIENFSMPHTMVVLTTGRPMALDEQQCPERLIECQVLGTRICIDYSNTCNGVPNCGSSNAYDEDRVLCRLIGPQRNVYLAAATFLSVLVTVMYIAHYWLKRCVPNVADAFFVYADSADNELYLDCIMRSPTDTAHDGNCLFDSTLFEDEHTENTNDERKSSSIFKRVLSILPNICLFKQRQTSSLVHEAQVARQGLPGEVPKKIYSFTELEIRNMISAAKVDREAQTGESLEMAYLKMINSFKHDSSQPRPSGPNKRQASAHAILLRDILTGERPSSSDMSSESPGPSGGSMDNYRRTDLPMVGEEEEIHSTFYDPGLRGNIIKSESSKNRDTAPRMKCLRFNDRTTCIPQEDDEEDSPEKEPVMRRRSVVYRLPGRMGKRHQKPDDDDSERGGSDFRKFFRMKDRK